MLHWRNPQAFLTFGKPVFTPQPFFSGKKAIWSHTLYDFSKSIWKPQEKITGFFLATTIFRLEKENKFDVIDVILRLFSE